MIAGIKKDLEALVSVLKDAGAKRAMLLDMSVASHCPLLESASAPLEEKLKEMLKDEFIAPVISNVTAKPYSTKEEALELLPEQLVKPVLRIVILKVQYILNFRSPEGIDTLGIVTHNTYILMFLPESIYNKILGIVRILVFINKYIEKLFLVAPEYILKIPEEDIGIQ